MDELKLMQMAAFYAGNSVLDAQYSAKKVEIKRGDFVTEQDHRSDRIIAEMLGPYSPGVTWYSEEQGGELRLKGKQWIVDAIDGTHNYYYGHQEWGISIALMEDGQTRIGVIYFPAVGLSFSAMREGDKIVPKGLSNQYQPHVNTRVSNEQVLAQARIWTDWVKGDNEVVFDILRKLQKHTTAPQIRSSCTASSIQVVLGKIDAYVHPHPQPEDIAAAGLIVEAFGGRVTDVNGDPWSPFSTSFVASNGLIHDSLLEVLK